MRGVEFNFRCGLTRMSLVSVSLGGNVISVSACPTGSVSCADHLQWLCPSSPSQTHFCPRRVLALASQHNTMEPELRAMWEEAERKFEAKTAKKLRGTGGAKTMADVIREMESRKVEDDSDGRKIKDRAKDIGQKVLSCIQLLGGIAAEGASIVSTTSLYHFPTYQCLSIGFPASWAMFQRSLIPHCYPRQG